MSFTLGNLLYFIRMNNSEVKQKTAETASAIKDLDKKFNDSKSVIKQWGQDFKNSINQTSKFAKKNKEAIQSAVVTSGAALAGLVMEIKKATKETVLFQNAMLGLKSVATAFGHDIDATTQAARDLAADGLMSITEAATSLKNLLASGFSLDQAIQLMIRFKDIAAFNRQAALSFGDAIRGATEGIKNGNSILVDNIGLTKNLSIIMREAGYSEQDVMRVTSDLNIRMAMFRGLIKETNPFIGDAAKLSEQLGGQLSKVEETTRRVHRAIGAAIEGPVSSFLTKTNDILISVAEWTEKNKELAGTLTLTVTGITAFVFAGSAILLSLDKIIKMVKLAKMVFLDLNVVFAFNAWRAGAATATEAIKFLTASCTPLLVGGAIVTGLLLIVSTFQKMGREAKLARTEISKITAIDEAKKVLDYWENEVKKLPSPDRLTPQFYKPDDLARERERVSYTLTQREAARRKLKELTKTDESGKTGDGDKIDLTKYLKDLDDKLKLVDKTAKAFGDTTNVNADKADILKDAIVELIERGIDPQDKQIQALVSSYNKYSDAAEDMEKRIKLEKESLDLVNQAKQEKIDWNNRELSTLELLAMKLDAQALLDIKNAAALREQAQAIRELVKAQREVDNQTKVVGLLAEAQEKLAEMTKKSIPEWETFANSLIKAASAEGITAEMANQLYEIAQQIREAGEAAESTDWEQIGKDINKSFKENLVDGLSDAILKAESLNDVFKNILQTMTEMALKKYILEPLVNDPSGFLSVIGSFFGSAHTGALVTPTGLIPSFHAGGLVASGLRSDERIIKVLVGERILSREENKIWERGFTPQINSQTNIINQSSQPVSAESKVDFDTMGNLTTTIILRDLDTGGPISRRLRGR